MALQSASEDEIISLLNYCPRNLECMIKIEHPLEPAKAWQATPSSSFGNLDVLSLELLHGILAELDFKTLSDISKTCIQGAVVVQSLPAYRDLMRHASQALIALGQTKLIRHHSAARLHAVLSSSECEYCHFYGPFLFLPTCERCCSLCLRFHSKLWVIRPLMARVFFAISAPGMKQIPIMRTIPGKYYGLDTESSYHLVCAGTAKEISVMENVSMMRLDRELQAQTWSSVGSARRELQLRNSLKNTSFSRRMPSFLGRSGALSDIRNRFRGLASMPFPSIKPGNTVEYGIWCKGCVKYWLAWQNLRIRAQSIFLK